MSDQIRLPAEDALEPLTEPQLSEQNAGDNSISHLLQL